MTNALVVGAGGGIGNAIHKNLEASGCYVLGTTRETLDLSDKTSIEIFSRQNRFEFDHIIFCAAENIPTGFIETTDYAINQSIQVNVLAFLQLLRGLLKASKVRPGGSVVIISSLFGHFGRAKRLPYVASKHALLGICKTLAVELSVEKIRVNSVSPGFIDTILTRKNIPTEQLSEIQKRIPLNRLGHVDEVANVVKFLVSDMAAYINGTDIIVDGGFFAGGFME